jgi:hypothetical protein
MRERIKRINRMEMYFDMVSQAFSIDSAFVKTDTHIKGMLEALREYFECGEWLEDYQADERGELPSDLKRGVLSEDGLWNLMSDIDSLDSIEK